MKICLPRAVRRSPAHTAQGGRSVIASARETLALVLDENGPPLEHDHDVDYLLLRLRGHLMELGLTAPDLSCPTVEKALAEARHVADIDGPGDYVRARVLLRRLAEAVDVVIRELAGAGLVCGHLPECPSADADDCEAARVRVSRPEIGCSELCNGVLLFDDTGCLMPSGAVVAPRRVLPRTGSESKAVDS